MSACAHGIQFPRTLTTNDPARATAFVQEMHEVVVKPGIGIGSTRRFREDQLGRTQDITLAPVTMQEFVRGQTYRVHIVGDTVVLSLRIINDMVDSRTETKGFEYAKLPEAAELHLVRANRLLGIHFAAWDVILADDGRTVCLDCNPGPYLCGLARSLLARCAASLRATWSPTRRRVQWPRPPRASRPSRLRPDEPLRL